ncbi:MAG: hypothetical protein K5894_10720, partial [Lachnospiraceae bacterium]|nr:hypothetical protein [Lachnospiraceae bacterium]
MAEYYEPNLFTTLSVDPNIVCAVIALKEPVDGEILETVVEELRARFPYFYIKPALRGNDLVTVDNPLPMVVRNTWDPLKFNSPESNYHMAAFKYMGNRLAFEIPHSITDGAG